MTQISEGEEDTVKEILLRGVKPELDQQKVSSLLSESIQHGYRWCRQVIRILLSLGLSADTLYEGKTPLWGAAAEGHYEIARILVDAGASLDWKSEGGYTPETIARKNRHIKIFRFLHETRKTRDEKSRAEATAST